MRNSVSAQERLHGFSKGKKDLLRLLREGKFRRAQSITPCPRVEGVGIPASWAQQRLWFIDQLEGGSAGYTVLLALRLRGTLDQESLQKALDVLVQRHEVLRTTFVSGEGDPMQEIASEGNFPLKIIDLSGHREAERELQVRLHETEEAHGKFDLRVGPLIRGRLLRVRPEEHVLLITMHHIIADGWSKGVLIREIAELYRAYQEGCDDLLKPLPVQYADYAQWQRQWLQGDTLKQQLSYWRSRLEGAAPHLELPTDRPRPVAQSYRGATVRVVLDAQLCAKLRAFAQRNEITLFMVLYAGWAILLSRLSGQEDVVIGTPVANRQRPEIEGLIGLFVNTLVLRLGVRSGLRLKELLEQVKEVTLGAYDHQDVPLEKIVEALQPQRSLSHNPLFQVMFVLHNWPKSELRLPGVTVTQEDAVDEPAIVDLWLSLEEQGDEIVGGLNYATDLFDEETVERWIACFTVLLNGMTDEPQSHICDLPLLAQSERDRIIESFNPMQTAYPQEKSIQELFQEQVDRTPQAVAVVYEGQALTYHELNRNANQLAWYLRDKGVGPDQLVGLCCERGLEMVVGLLGILKAGGAYLPLDPNYPTDRLAYMLEDARPRLLLIQKQLREKLPDTAAEVIALDEDWNDIAEKPMGNLDVKELGLQSRHLAYVIYTSGSTGRPKGVMVEHHNVIRLFSATAQWFNFNERDVWTLFHSVAFDFSVWELWGGLFYGGRVVVVPYFTARSPQDFYSLVCEQGVTVLNQTPSAFAQLIHAQSSAETRHSLRVVIFGGEALELRTLQPWVDRNGVEAPQLVNMYGITETTVHVTYRLLTADEIALARGSPIGTPISDLRAYLLDSRKQPVPIGVTAELYIGGAGVARGYLNRPELTAERFLPDPFCSDAQARIYKTGDLGRWRADGTIEYLGRNDCQVKIRGFRIELGEIEAQLVRHAQVKEAVVLAREDVPGQKRLVAYVISDNSSGASGVLGVDALRAHLQAILPEYMVPSAFVLLDRFPLTSNGKLDKAALPLPDVHAIPMRQYVAPRNELERRFCEIWEQVLGIERVGIEDNFFAIGGDSILSLRVLARSQALGVTFGVVDLFRHQCIAQLARAIEAGEQGGGSWQKVAEFELLTLREKLQFAGVAGIEDVYPLSLLQEGMYFHTELAPDSSVYHDIFGCCIETAFHREHFECVVRGLVQRHPVLRTGFGMSCEHRLVQLVHKDVALVLQVEDISQLGQREQDEYVREWLEREKHHGFAWSEPPLLRVFVHIRAQDRFQYSLSFHHAILDGWSVASLQTELINHYSNLIEGREQAIDAPKVLYRDFIARERQALQSASSKEYWQGMLEGASLPSLPKSGDSRGRFKGREVETHAVSLESKMSRGLERRAKQLGVHLKLLLLAAHVKVMSVTFGGQAVLTGVVSHGRLEEEDGERVLGLHLNSLPLRVERLEGSWRDLVMRLRDLEETMLPHRYYPLAAIQELIGSQKLFDTLFNFTRFHVYNQVEEGVKVSEAEGFELTNFSLVTYFSQELHGSGISLSLSFDPAVLDRTQIERIGGYYERALRTINDDIDASHDAETLLGEAERHRLLVQFNRTASPCPPDRLIHELFQDQVERIPEAFAVAYEGQLLTYAELNGRANQLARYLRDKGVGPDQVVGICVERSVEMVVGLLGILKAGGAYVPLDPNYPAERLHYMLDDVAPQVVLTQEKLRTALPPTSAEVIALDAEWGMITRCADDSLSVAEAGVTGQSLVYVIYTSGSTGLPKGVAMAHRSMVNLIEWHRKIFPKSEGKRVLQFAALSFDVAFQEIFSTLCTGGTLVLLDESTRRDAQALAEFLRSRSIERLFVPPLMLQSLAECFTTANEVQLSSLEDVITAGEQLHISQEVLRFFKLVNGCRLHNHYGPTETHVVTALTLTGDPGEWPALPAIGQPISNTQIYVLDELRRPVPIGVVGEIYLGGAGVARGYLKRPELTTERFVANPFSTDLQARLYKTGDLGRWLADGTVEYLGRNDSQVKIRGYRIELGEIEAQLARHMQVKEAAVVAREDVPGERRLVGYVTLRDQSKPSVADLRASLLDVLPEYMVPSAFVILKSLPLTPNGKLDRRALPMPELGAFVSRQYESPKGEVEEILAGIWQELLRVERVGRQENFFELGGHSLNGIKLIARTAERFMVRLSVAAVFQYPTVQQMAQAVESLRSVSGEPLSAEGMEFEEGTI